MGKLTKEQQKKRDAYIAQWGEGPHYTVDCIIVNRTESQFVMIKRKFDPQAGKLALVGGFVDKGETPFEAVRREIEEEVSIKRDNENLVFLYNADTMEPLTVTLNDPDRDPTRGRVISTVFFAHYKGEDTDFQAGDDAGDVVVIDIDKVGKMKPYKLFLDHWKAIDKMLRTTDSVNLILK